MVTSPSRSPVIAEVPWMNNWNISTQNTEQETILKQTWHEFLLLYHLKICPIFKYFQESLLAVQILVNNEECDLTSLALCKCLLLITVANTATCTSWLKKKHMLWSHKPRHKQNDLIKGTLAHKSIQHCSAICSWKRSARPGTFLWARWGHRRKTAAGEQKEIWHLELGLRIQMGSFWNIQYFGLRLVWGFF